MCLKTRKNPSLLTFQALNTTLPTIPKTENYQLKSFPKKSLTNLLSLFFKMERSLKKLLPKVMMKKEMPKPSKKKPIKEKPSKKNQSKKKPSPKKEKPL